MRYYDGVMPDLFKTSSTTWSRILLGLLILETSLGVAYSVLSKPFLEFSLRTEIGKNYSLLIDDERFPINATGNQKLLIQVFGRPGDSQPLPRARVHILYPHPASAGATSVVPVPFCL